MSRPPTSSLSLWSSSSSIESGQGQCHQRQNRCILESGRVWRGMIGRKLGAGLEAVDHRLRARESNATKSESSERTPRHDLRFAFGLHRQLFSAKCRLPDNNQSSGSLYEN
ncbi:hypothetical protein CPB83DRAFT_463009 [Crepidotus variabilis]|uniref:Uncharacterized protein n=1 Tax=Crepidotus variabilis TaxID=179855 RepID=A0A9P6ECK2_9AGAR|nr:hypothetical protein CPB83DRAFT_463009 [Crepidotus variabilis]